MNNVKKIKQEAQNLRDKLNDRVNENEFIAGEVFILNYFLSYIDLHNEPVSIDFEQELYKAFGQVKDFTLGMRIAKWFYDKGKNSQEPVSEESEKAADIYGDELDNVLAVCDDNDEDNTIGEYAKEAFKAGAEWQKNKMMKDAIEGTICTSAPEPLVVIAEVKEEDGFKFADRVKIIVIKED